VEPSATPTPVSAPTPAIASTPDPWQFRRTDADPRHFAQDESLFALANGTLGVRGGLEEDNSTSHGCFLSGVWERTPIEYHERFTGFARHTDTRIPIPDGTRIRLHLGNMPLNLSGGTWLAFERELDLRDGCYRRTLRWRAPTDVTLEITAERLVALDEPGLLTIRYSVRSIDYSGPITLESAIDASRAAVAQGTDPRIGARLDGGLRTTDAHADATWAWICQHTTNSGIRVACGQHHLTALAHDGAAETSHGVAQRFSGTLTPGSDVVLEKHVAYAWSSPGSHTASRALVKQVEKTLEQAAATGHAALLDTQRQGLERFWRDVDLAIEGDDATEQALRFNLFHLFQSSCRDGSGSTAAKGLTGEGYEGHYFWDTEAFMLPVLATTAPAFARGVLLYRHRMLNHARQHARELNHTRGALYPWRTIGGDECSAYFPSGSAQYHINAAIAWAIQLYVESTGDNDFLREHGAEMLFETARLWLEVGHFNPRHNGAFCIHSITGPDEYSALVDNNHYTNRMAQRHLRYAAQVANWLATTEPAAHAALATHIGLSAHEPAQWQRAADAMYLPVDARLNIFPQDDAFLDKPHLPPEITRDTSLRPLLLHLHPLSIYRHQVCKQADTLLALMLAGEHVSRDAKRRNFDYYESVTVHDSTLSASTFAVIAAQVGYAEKAWRYFLETLRVDLDDLHGNAAHGVHMAAMAGSWLALTWGFGGLRISEGRPTLSPQLPTAWRGYRFGLRWREARLRVEVDAKGVRYTLIEGTALNFMHYGVPHTLYAGQTLQLPHIDVATVSHNLQRRAWQAVIFDLDGVLADTAVVHDAAWRQLAEEIGVPFDATTGERLKGVDRRGSLDILLERASRAYSETEKQALSERKNDYYRQQIERFGPQQLLPGAHAAVAAVRNAGLKVGLASASRNAPLLLERLGIADLFDYIVDAGQITRSKPDPEIFLAAAAGLRVAPADCLGVEDAAAGVASIRAAGMTAIGIGDPLALSDADQVLPNMTAFNIANYFTARKPHHAPLAQHSIAPKTSH